MSSISNRTVRLLRIHAASEPLDLSITGNCMAPLLTHGARVLIAKRRHYWPGDLVVVHATDGRLLAHRLLGPYPRRKSLYWLTQADSASRPDPGVPFDRLIGKIVGGQVAHRAVRIRLSDRILATHRLLKHALRATLKKLLTCPSATLT